MRKLAQASLLGAVVLLAGLQLDRLPGAATYGAPPADAAGEPGAAAKLERSGPPTVSPGHLRAFLRSQRIPHQHLDLRELAERVNQAAARNDLEPAMVMAVIRVESTFRPAAISDKGALGLMQILPGTAQELAAELGLPWEGEHRLLDPDLNIELGAYYLRKLLNRFDGDREAALEAYFQGPTRLARMRARDRSVPLRYARRVIPYWDDPTWTR